MYTTYEKKPKQGQSPLRKGREAVRQGGMPNSVLRGVVPEGERGSGDLEQRMQNRLPAVPVRVQAQIPQAEAEADRLSANVAASSPEGVKADLGRRMGADFSGVRFHTGADAAARANAMGARAFTSGADVYFGEGGFNPTVAAHELVHTVQQGMVDSAAATMSTPVGGVQMWSNPFGRMIRKHHDAIDELHEVMSGGEWNNLDNKQKLSWIMRNPIAYARYKMNQDKNGDVSGKFKDKIDNRATKRANELSKAAAFLQGRTVKSSMLGDDPDVDIGMQNVGTVQSEDPRTSARDKVDALAGATDNFVSTPLGVANGFQGAAQKSAEDAAKAAAAQGQTVEVKNMGGNVTGAIGGILGTATGGYSAAMNVVDLVKGEGDATDNVIDLVGNLSTAGGALSSFSDALGAAEAAGNAASGFGIINGVVSGIQGSQEIHEGRKKASAMKDYLKGAGKREDLEKENLLLRDIAAQGKMEGTRQKIEGSGKLITGAMDATAASLDLGGVTAFAGAGVNAASAATKAGFAIANAVQENRMKKKVVEQTTGLTDDVIRQFQKDNNIGSFSRAKQALMKAMGYSSGTRAELYADQTERRGNRLADMANANRSGNASTVAKGLAGEKGANENYSGEELSKAMGLRESRSSVASRFHRLKAMLGKKL